MYRTIFNILTRTYDFSGGWANGSYFDEIIQFLTNWFDQKFARSTKWLSLRKYFTTTDQFGITKVNDPKQTFLNVDGNVPRNFHEITQL